MGAAGQWTMAAHVLDFDDLHLESTAHISAVMVPVVLACGGGYRDYLAGAGVMARLGSALGWSHYERGWHSTCTAGGPAAAAAAAIIMGLDPVQTAHAMVLALPGTCGIQRVFGTDGKALQVGEAAEAGVRGARLAANGARGELEGLEAWMELLGADHQAVDTTGGPAIPGGLAIKLYPCGYAAQRSMAAVRESFSAIAPSDVKQITVRLPAANIKPLTYHRPTTGAQAKFSLEYSIAAALLDPYPGFGSYTDDAVHRPEAQRIMDAVRVIATPGGTGLLFGAVEITLETEGHEEHRAYLEVPPGAPGHPPTEEQLRAKSVACGAPNALVPGIAPGAARTLMLEHLPLLEPSG
jgi:2-methylcitrate dehydratase PrpD